MPIAVVPLADDAPSGENLEYDQVFTDLMLVSQPGEERQAGAEILAAAEPDAKAIAKHAEAVLEQSHDLRAALLYGYARTRLAGFEGLAEATGYLRAALSDFWESCHPQLDAEDDDDPTMRVNAVRGLADPKTMLRAVKDAPLTESRAFGAMTLRDLAIVEGETPAPADMDSPPTAQAVSAAFKDTDIERLRAIYGAAKSALEDVQAINAIFDERVPGQGPALDALSVLLRRAVKRLGEQPGVVEEEEAEVADAPAEDGEAAAEGAPAAVRTAPPGTITSRKDVEAALDRIIQYYATYEPSSPLPILLQRGRRLVGADFMTILTDLAPLGVDSVKLIGGMENPE